MDIPGTPGYPSRMDSRLKRLRLGAFRHCITLRCEGSCAWCANCRGSEPPGGWDRSPKGHPGGAPCAVRLHGGDAFRYGDLSAWTAWARGNPRAWIDLEGPAASLGGDDADAVLARITGAGVDGVVAVLPSTDEARSRSLTGHDGSPSRALDALATLAEQGVAVVVVVPLNADTVEGLRQTVLACAERLGDRVDIVLRRAHPVRVDPRRLPVLGAETPWEELDRLSREIAALPATLPRGARLHMDAEWGYAPCMLRPDARRVDLVATRGDDSRAPLHGLGDTCEACAWALRCAWRGAHGAPPRSQVRPLDVDQALALQELADDPEATHRPHAPRARWSRGEAKLPDVLCVAPWTSLSATETILHPVPCAMSWTVNAVPPDEAAAAMGLSVDEWLELQRAAQRGPREVWYCTDNDAVPLAELWNNPLLRVMRKQMFAGPGPTRHCRSMCRTVMGVEDRGADLLAVPDAELSPEVVANRRLLLDEMRAGRTVLTALPLDLVMGVASHCNIDCGFCQGPQGEFGELTDARRDEIAAWLPSLMSFTVSGPGEPLMSRNYLSLLHEIAERAYPSLRVSVTTNGTLLTPAFLERHAAVRWAHVRISLNAGSEATHERMTGKRLWGRVMENLDALCALRDARERPFEVTLSCVLSEMVMGDLRNFAEIATSRRAHIVVEPMYGDMGGLSPWARPSKLRPMADELAAVADEFALKNPPLSKAFRAVERFARRRLEGDDFAPLDHH